MFKFFSYACISTFICSMPIYSLSTDEIIDEIIIQNKFYQEKVDNCVDSFCYVFYKGRVSAYNDLILFCESKMIKFDD